MAFILSVLNCSNEVFTYQICAYQFSGVAYRLILLEYNLISYEFSPPVNVYINRAFRDLTGDLNSDFFLLSFAKFKLWLTFWNISSMETIIKMLFGPELSIFLFYFLLIFFFFVYYLLANMKLWSSSCKIFHCLSIPFNNRTFYKTFFFFFSVKSIAKLILE